MFYGSIVLAIAWVTQLYFWRKGQRSLNPWFLRLSALGFLILVMETFSSPSKLASWPNLISLVVLLFLLFKSKK